MSFTIPANHEFGADAAPLFDWISSSGVDVVGIDPGHPVTIRQDAKAIWYLDGVTAFAIERSWQIADYITTGALTWLENSFGISVPDSIELDMLSGKIEQLREARKIAAEQKAIADELRAEVLAAAVAAGARVQTADDGETVTATITLNGVPVMVAKTSSKDRFQTAAFKTAYPELAAQYTKSSDETRLEFVK